MGAMLLTMSSALPFIIPSLAPYSIVIWASSVVIFLSVLTMLGLLFVFQKLVGRLRADIYSRLALYQSLQTIPVVKTDINALDHRIHDNVMHSPVSNFGGYQKFNRKLFNEHIEMFEDKWLAALDLEITPKALHYLAHRICMLEANSKGRLATNIEDILLRTLVARLGQKQKPTCFRNWFIVRYRSCSYI